MIDRKLRVGLIGTGDFGPYFAPYVNEVAELVAVCDPNPTGLANFSKQAGLNLPEFDHHEKLLKVAGASGSRPTAGIREIEMSQTWV